MQHLVSDIKFSSRQTSDRQLGELFNLYGDKRNLSPYCRYLRMKYLKKLCKPANILPAL